LLIDVNQLPLPVYRPKLAIKFLRGSEALDELLAGKPISVPQTNPIGCNVKWDGKDAHWMPPDACDLV